MAWTPFNPAKPVIDGSRLAEIDATRNNLLALRSLLCFGGVVPGFNYNWGGAGGTVDKPTQVWYTKGAEWISAVLTWGTSGGADGAVTKAAFYYSSDTGASYAPMADDAGAYVLTLSWTAAGYLNSATWGSTP